LREVGRAGRVRSGGVIRCGQPVRRVYLRLALAARRRAAFVPTDWNRASWKVCVLAAVRPAADGECNSVSSSGRVGSPAVPAGSRLV